MDTLYIECKMGAAGDMLMAALYELCPQKKEFLDAMHQAFGDMIRIAPQPGNSCGIYGTHMEVTTSAGTEDETHMHNQNNDAHKEKTTMHAHTHHSYFSILAKIKSLPLPEKVRHDAAEVYRLIGEAESKVHHMDIDQIHFHEVGTLDALADVTGVCLLMSMLAPKRILCSPVHVGNGTVHCAHGILPVPAPATAILLQGIPYYTGTINSELCTPTGAALIKYFASEFTDMQPMNITQTGIGIGTKEFPAANIIRIFSGTPLAGHDCITDISCNIDDMTGEDLGFAMECLLEAGALDVFYQPIQMKKNRPGILLHCFCEENEQERFMELVLKHTTTRGVRYQKFMRRKLESSYETADTPYGQIRIKKSEGYGIQKRKAEYEDLKEAAQKYNLPLEEVRRKIPQRK